MDNLDAILQEILCGAYNRIITQESYLLKRLGGLTLKEFHTLDVIAKLSKNKTNSSANIAKMLDITPSTLSINLDRLESKDLVCRTKSDMDKRVILVNLTALAINIRKKRENAHKKIINDVISKLNNTEKVALTSAFNKIDL